MGLVAEYCWCVQSGRVVHLCASRERISKHLLDCMVVHWAIELEIPKCMGQAREETRTTQILRFLDMAVGSTFCRKWRLNSMGYGS